MNKLMSKYELIFIASLSGALVGCIAGCFIVVFAQIDYHANSEMLVIWFSTCMLVLAVVGAKIGYKLSKSNKHSQYLVNSNENEADIYFSA